MNIEERTMMKMLRYVDNTLALLFGATVTHFHGLLFALLTGLGTIIIWASGDYYFNIKTRGKK